MRKSAPSDSSWRVANPVSSIVIQIKKNTMKNIICLLILAITVYSQTKENILTIAVVNSDSMIIPVGRFVGDSLINIYNNTNVWKEFETNIYEWYYLPFNRSSTKPGPREKIYFQNGDDKIKQTYGSYGFNFRIERNFKRKIMGANIITGIASNKRIDISFMHGIQNESNHIIFQKIPKTLVITPTLREKLNKAYPNQIFQDSIKFIYNHCSYAEFNDGKYYRFVNYYFLDGAYNYTDFIYRSGWIIQTENFFTLLSISPISLNTYNENEDDDQGSSDIIAVLQYNKRLYYIMKNYLWKSIEFELTEINF